MVGYRLRFAIVDKNGYFLEATSRNYGAAGGVGRVWTPDVRKALTWELRGEALVVLDREYGDTAKYLDVAVCEVEK